MFKTNMTGGRIARILLVLFALASTFFSLSPSAVAASSGPIAGTRVLVYYFHGSLRCETCLFIEAVAEQTLRAEFPGELADGTLAWHPLNVEASENAHFVADFALKANELVIVRQRDGSAPSWEKIPGLWDLAADPGLLSQQLRVAVNKALKKRG